MKTFPTVFEYSMIMLAAASSFLLLMLLMRWIATRFFDGDEKKLRKYFG